MNRQEVGVEARDRYDKPEIDVSPGSMHPAICKLRYGAIDYPPNWFRDKANGRSTP
jgi:hypothetical protein